MNRKALGPVVLLILDGWGLREETSGNAIALAHTPNWDRLWRTYPTTALRAAGEAVGLVAGQMGNSNVGHLNLGAGRVVYQDIVRINRAIRSGDLAQNPQLRQVFTQVLAAPGRTLHLLGLLSDGGVHSHQEHLHALITYAAQAGIRRLAVHCFLDGRDVPPRSAQRYLADLEAHLRQTGVGRIATVAGRYYAMDRDRRWERTAAAYRALVYGQGLQAASAQEALRPPMTGVRATNSYSPR